ncbi:MAG: hypothetical protein ACYCPM_02610 [Acidobacteriaceae bacterium]
MKRTFGILSILSLAFVMTAATFGQASSVQQAKPEHLGKHQLNTLIATAKTPAEHQRIAQYYQAKAQDYLAQANEHEAMIAAYKANPSPSTAKNLASTIGHCEYFFQTFKDMAVKSQELAALHEQMAKDAEQK